MRGTWEIIFHQAGYSRFIPARAGNVPAPTVLGFGSTVQPRSCGERSLRHKDPVIIPGSSPLVRGTSAQHAVLLHLLRFIPARAGNVKSSCLFFHYSPVHPRSCGERFQSWFSGSGNDGSSPLVRGTWLNALGPECGRRFIPARAGNVSRAGQRIESDMVHPRSCGERRTLNCDCNIPAGSSPLVRGTWNCICY